MVTDTVGDMLTRVRNAYLARQKSVSIPNSRLIKRILGVLSRLRYIGEITAHDKDNLKVTLVYHDDLPAITGIKRLSRPGLRRYASRSELKDLQSRLGYVIVSTPSGIKTHVEALKDGQGGELICKVW